MNKIFAKRLVVGALSSIFSLMASCSGSSDNKIIAPDVPSVVGPHNPLARLEVPKVESGNIFI